MDSEELDSQRRQERFRRRGQRECDARTRETAEQREARLARRRERYRAQRRQESQHTQLSAHALLSLSQAYIRTSSCMHSGGAHSPSHVVLQETVYRQHLLQLAQARPTMPAFTSILVSLEGSIDSAYI